VGFFDMKDIKIRFLNASDTDQMKEISELFKDDMLSMGADSKHGFELLNSPTVKTIVAESGDKIVGAVSFYDGFSVDAGKIYNLPFLIIRPEYRGSRIILSLFNELKEIAAKDNVKSFVFSVYGKNEGAKKLYERIGATYMADVNEHFMFLDL